MNNFWLLLIGIIIGVFLIPMIGPFVVPVLAIVGAFYLIGKLISGGKSQ